MALPPPKTQHPTLQHIAPHCTTLQHTAAHCHTLQRNTLQRNTFQRNALQRNTLQQTATHCTTLQYTHPKTLFEIAMALFTISVSFPSKSRVSATLSILLRFGESWNPTNCEKFNADGSQMGRMNLDQSVW